jgi:hypothetical protein
VIDPPFSSVALQAYLMEIRELADRVLFRLEQLEHVSNRWSAARAEADQLLSGRMDPTDKTATYNALGRQLVEQGELFDQLEALLATWARLSLLLQPSATRGDAGGFAQRRGELLRTLMGIKEQSILLDRELRNSWMHFDERLDHVIRLKGRWGNRHRFTESSEHERDAGTSIRTITVDRLEVTFLDNSGALKTTSLRALRSPLLEIPERCRSATEEYRKRFATLNGEDL